MAAGRKQVAFDLDTNALKDYYPSENSNNAYEAIKRHMLKNGFLWQQGSVYVSQKPMTSTEVEIIVESFVEKNPWINVCMRDCRQSNIGREHNLNHLFVKDACIPKRRETYKPQRKKGLDAIREMSISEKKQVEQSREREMQKER